MYTYYRELLRISEEFERQHANPADWTLLNFAAWLNRQLTVPEVPRGEGSGPASPETPADNLEGTISMLVGFMYRYAKVYLKKVLEGTDMKSPDDFGYIAGLIDEDGLSKMELIGRNLHEKTSGMEVLKRLLAAGLVEQRDHPTDRRSKLIFLTEKGRSQFYHILPKLQLAARIVTGDLAESEKWQLLYLLRKLDGFHRPVFVEHREKSLEEIWARLIFAPSN